MEKFFKDELMVSQIGGGSCSDADTFKVSGNLDLCIDTLEKLTSDEGWVLVTTHDSDSMRMISITPKIPNNWLIINDVKSLYEMGQEKNYLTLIAEHDYNSPISLHSMGEWVKSSPGDNMPPKAEWGDISIGGVWFDTDDDWDYTYLSKFFQGYMLFNDNAAKAWLIQLTEGPLPLLNWMFNFYDSLFELVGVKV
jgi:hypothetical protein